jgi:hypothetical protein
MSSHSNCLPDRLRRPKTWPFSTGNNVDLIHGQKQPECSNDNDAPIHVDRHFDGEHFPDNDIFSEPTLRSKDFSEPGR